MVRRKTNAEFAKEVYDLVGDEYVFKEDYINSATAISVKHLVCGHVYDVVPNRFLNGTRCPRCALDGRRKTNIRFIEEVYEIVGDEYTFLEEYKHSNTEITVRHNLCGKVYRIKPHVFLNVGSRCPDCSYSKRTKSDEEFKSEVSDLVGDEYTFLKPYIKANTKLPLRHNVCRTVYWTAPNTFLSGHRCLKCHHTNMSLLRRMSEKEFIQKVKTVSCRKYKYVGGYVNMKRKVKVTHLTCGHSYEVFPGSFLKGQRCPKCNVSLGEEAVNNTLKTFNLCFLREHSFNDLGRRRYDFYIPSLKAAIEFDGRQHFESIEFWGGEEALIRTQESDHLKNEYCANNRIHLLRIPYWDFDRVDELVVEFINEIKTNPVELITPNYVPNISKEEMLV